VSLNGTTQPTSMMSKPYSDDDAIIVENGTLFPSLLNDYSPRDDLFDFDSLSVSSSANSN
jgi:hypothetical protein